MDIDFARGLVWSQFGAAIQALENAVRACPEDAWSKGPEAQQFWYLAYHALFFLDLYLSPRPNGFQPPAPFSTSEMNPLGKMPPRIYNKEEILGYVEWGRQKCKKRIQEMPEVEWNEMSEFGWVKVPKGELFLYNMRHVQHHVGQLNLILRKEKDMGSRWVFKAD